MELLMAVGIVLVLAGIVKVASLVWEPLVWGACILMLIGSVSMLAGTLAGKPNYRWTLALVIIGVLGMILAIVGKLVDDARLRKASF